MRAAEALAIRIKDIDFSASPTRVHIRKEYAKTRVARDVYISDEATQYVKAWISWKYRNRSKAEDDLVFGVGRSADPRSLYYEIAHESSKNLELAGFVERKDGSTRHKVTLHSFRRFADSTITDLAGKDYAEWFLGHKKNSYYTKKERERREIYATKCMKYLTFLDYSVLEAAGNSTEARLQEKAKEIQALKEQMAKMEESQLKITELLEVMKIAKSSGGKLGWDRSMLDEKDRVTVGYVDDNNQRAEMKVPLDGFEIDAVS